jgi:hypothetical protein
MLKKVAAITAATAILPLAAAPALAKGISTTVVPFVSVGGIKLNWTVAQVNAHAGKPTAVFHDGGHIDGEQFPGDIQVDFFPIKGKDLSSNIGASGGGYHTVKGIRIGTSKAAIQKKLKGFDNFSCNNLGCTIMKGSSSTGTYQTSFGFEGGRLSSMGISYSAPF